MKRATILGLGVFLVMISLSAGARAYTISLSYGIDSNYADGSADGTSNPPVTGPGNITYLQTGTWGTNVQVDVWPAVVSGATWDCSQPIIYAKSATNSSTGSGWGRGNPIFGFRITTADANYVWATVGYSFIGDVKINNGGNGDQIALTYRGTLIDTEITPKYYDILPLNTETWGVLGGQTYNLTGHSGGDTRNFLLQTNKDYTLDLLLMVESLGGAYTGENSVEFNSYVCVNGITLAPLPATVWLLAGSLILLGGVARRR